MDSMGERAGAARFVCAAMSQVKVEDEDSRNRRVLQDVEVQDLVPWRLRGTFRVVSQLYMYSMIEN